MANKEYLDKAGTTYLAAKTKGYIDKKVDKVEGKGLSTNDYTDAEKLKLATMQNVVVDSTLSTTSENPVQNKVINAELSKKASEEFVTGAISTAIAGLEKDRFVVVEELPEVGTYGKIYLVPSKNAQDKNIKDEYLWVDQAWELIGSTNMDLSGYLKETDLVPISNEEIDAMWT